MDRDDLDNWAVQRACELAAGSDVITFDQLNALLPATQFTAEQIEQLLNRLARKGIQIFDQ